MGTLSICLTITVVICLEAWIHSTEANTTPTPGVKCMKDKDGPDAPVNIYYCADAKKPECCEEEKKFTCCESQASKNKREQLMLWLPLAFIFTGVAILCICYRSELHICEGPSLKERCKSCINKKKPESEPLKESKEFNDIEDGKSRSSTPLSRPPSVFSNKSRHTFEIDESRPSSAAISHAGSQQPLSANN